MIGTVHLLTGAALGAILPSPAGIFVTAFLSHYLLDLLPHVDPDTFASAKRPYTTSQRVGLLADIIIITFMIVFFLVAFDRWLPILLGSIAAQLPDWLSPLERYSFFGPFKRFHEMFHWDITYAKRWSWYVVGLVAPAAIGVASITILMLRT